MDIRELYQNAFEKFNFSESSKKLLTRIMAGDEDAEDFDETLAPDAFFTEILITSASRSSKMGAVKSIAHAVSLIGKEKCRDFVFAHTISRNFAADADLKFQTIEKTSQGLSFAHQAEQLAKTFECPHVGLAFAAGLLFDVFNRWKDQESVIDEKFSKFFMRVWQHSQRTAIIAWGISSHRKIKNPPLKSTFVAGLLHDIGKLTLAFSTPSKYLDLLLSYNAEQAASPNDDSFEAELEMEKLHISHAEVGSLLLWQVSPYRELETIPDYHHDFSFLKVRDRNLNQLVIILSIADRLAFLLESNRSPNPEDIEPILSGYKKLFPLSAKDLSEMLLTLRAKSTLL